MGIKRLYSYIWEAFEPASMSLLRGKWLGIDAMCMLYQAYFSAIDNENEFKLSIIRHINQKIQIFKDNDIKFVFVVDGLKLTAKEKTDKLRQKRWDKFKDIHDKCKIKRSLRSIWCSRDLHYGKIQYCFIQHNCLFFLRFSQAIKLWLYYSSLWVRSLISILVQVRSNRLYLLRGFRHCSIRCLTCD